MDVASDAPLLSTMNKVIFTLALFWGATLMLLPGKGFTEKELAFFHAPIIYQDTEAEGESQDEGNPAGRDTWIQRRGDFIARVDFDGDWNGLNNWRNFGIRPASDRSQDKMARAYAYYSVVETETHYFINYCMFHAQDREPSCSDGECHENDLEGGLHVIKKGPENNGMGTLWLMMYLAHDYYFTYLTEAGKAAGIKLGGKPPHETAEKAHHYNADFIYDVVWRGVTPDGKLITPENLQDPAAAVAPGGTVFRPTVWSEPFGHGLYGWPGPNARSPYPRYRREPYKWIDGFVNGDGVIYVPGAVAETPDYNKKIDIARYELIDIFEAGGLWDRRNDIDLNKDGCKTGRVPEKDCLYGYYGAFRGQVWGTDKANAPWRWDHDDDNLPPGMQAYDPIRLVEEFNDLSALDERKFSRVYTNNKFLGIPRGTRPERPAPYADAGPDLVVRPGERFRLNGARSRTADYDGRGHLEFWWTCQDASWRAKYGDRLYGAQPVVSLDKEGTYLITLTVNDGDHSASDAVKVVVDSRLLFFDNFESDLISPAWHFTGGRWEQRDGALSMLRPGGANNLALLVDKSYPDDLEISAKVRLDTLYQEASVPLGLAVRNRSYEQGRAYVGYCFGFVGTRRDAILRDRTRRHLTELRFYASTGLGAYPSPDAAGFVKPYALGKWYNMKLMASGGTLRAKVWDLEEAEPDWQYSVTWDQSTVKSEDLRKLSSSGAPALSGGAATSGEISFDDVAVFALR